MAATLPRYYRPPRLASPQPLCFPSLGRHILPRLRSLPSGVADTCCYFSRACLFSFQRAKSERGGERFYRTLDRSTFRMELKTTCVQSSALSCILKSFRPDSCLPSCCRQHASRPPKKPRPLIIPRTLCTAAQLVCSQRNRSTSLTRLDRPRLEGIALRRQPLLAYSYIQPPLLHLDLDFKPAFLRTNCDRYEAVDLKPLGCAPHTSSRTKTGRVPRRPGRA